MTNILIGYVIAYGCNLQTKEKTTAISKVYFVWANSYDEAIGIGVRKAREEFPSADGYTSHWGIAVSVSLTREHMQEKLNGAL